MKYLLLTIYLLFIIPVIHAKQNQKENIKHLTVNCGSLYTKNHGPDFITKLSNDSGKSIHKIDPDYLFFIGVGGNLPNYENRDRASVTSDYGMNISVFKCFLRNDKFTFGLNAGFENTFSSKDPHYTFHGLFDVKSQRSAMLVYKHSGRVLQSCFKFEIGPQINLRMNSHLLLSTIFQAGFVQLTQKEFSFYEIIEYNGSSYNYTLFGQNEIKTRGLAIHGKLRILYIFNRNMGLWVEVNRAVGPIIKSAVINFVPQGNPDQYGQYDIQQMNSGQNKITAKEILFSTLGVNIGIVFGIHKL
jgi:hypothetical protein